MGPSIEEENLQENAGYNASEVKLFPHNSILPDAGRLCERGKYDVGHLCDTGYILTTETAHTLYTRFY